MIQILETTITAKLSLSEARTLYKLLEQLPADRVIDSGKFTRDEWAALCSIFVAFRGVVLMEGQQ